MAKPILIILGPILRCSLLLHEILSMKYLLILVKYWIYIGNTSNEILTMPKYWLCVGNIVNDRTKYFLNIDANAKQRGKISRKYSKYW